MDAGITPVNSLHPTLEDAINPTDVFIAFICNDYEPRIAGKEEFPLAVNLRQQSGEKQKPAIIPLTLTIDGRTFWNDTFKENPAVKGIVDEPFFQSGSTNLTSPKDDKNPGCRPARLVRLHRRIL